MTKHVEQLRLESQVLTEKNRNESLESYTSTISHEFKTPLGITLMLLESLPRAELSESARGTLDMVIAQLNLLLSLVNGVIDIGSIV